MTVQDMDKHSSRRHIAAQGLSLQADDACIGAHFSIMPKSAVLLAHVHCHSDSPLTALCERPCCMRSTSCCSPVTATSVAPAAVQKMMMSSVARACSKRHCQHVPYKKVGLS